MIGVVILNYIAYETTINCVKSFINQEDFLTNYYIVIVDNCSPNKSFDELVRHFKNFDNISVIRAATNLGFANGNNYGFDYLIKKSECDFIIFCNDDILLSGNDILLNWIKDCYNKYHFGILGPKVYSVNGDFYQSPLKNYPQKIVVCKVRLLKQTIKLYIYKLFKLFHIKHSQNSVSWTNDHNINEVQIGATLHGSFLIMSKEYLSSFDKPFDPGTFLYMEEDILKLRCDKKNIAMVYSPEYEVQHLQAVTTNLIVKDYNEKMIFRIKNIRKSLKRYIQLLKNNP